MASIDKRGNGWRVRWRNLGGSARSRKCPDKATAQALKRDIEQQLALGQDWQPTAAPEPIQPTLLEGIVKDWLTDRALEISSSWLKTLAISWDVMIASLEAAHPGQPITPEMLTEKALRGLYHYSIKVRNNSPDTAVTRVKAIESEWRLMWESEALSTVVPPPRRLRLKRPVQSSHPAPTWAQMDAALRACRAGLDRCDQPENRYRLLFLARALGLRHGQLLHLEWRDIDLTAAQVHVRTGKSRQERRGRIVPLPTWAVEELAGWGVRRGKVIPADAPSRSLLRAWQAAEVAEEVWRKRPLHAFRHGIITGLRAAGVEESLVGYLVGHASGTTTGNTYTDWTLLEAPLRAAVAHNPAPQIGQVLTLAQAKK